MNIEIPTIEEDNLFKESAYVRFLKECTSLLLDNDNQEVYKHDIHIELVCIRRNIERLSSAKFWKSYQSLVSLKKDINELNEVDENVRNILHIWQEKVLPWTDTYMTCDPINYMFKTRNADTPLKIKIFCDVILRKEYTLDGYSFNNTGPISIFKEPYDRIIEIDIFKNHEHEANTKLLVSEHSNTLGMQDLLTLTTKYAHSAQKNWPSLIPTQKAQLLINVLRMFKTKYSEIDSSQILSTYLSELTQYDDFSRFITLNKIFEIQDKDIMTSIFTNQYPIGSEALPEIL